MGGALGVIAPLSIALMNEIGYAHYRGGDFATARICFADRHWEFLNLRVRHAPGCRNKFIDTIPLFMVLFAGGGAVLGMYSSRSKFDSTKLTDNAILSKSQSSILPSFSTIKNREFIRNAQLKSLEAINIGKDFAEKKIQELPIEGLKQKAVKSINDFPANELQKAISGKARELQCFIRSQEIPQNIKGITKGKRPNTATSICITLFAGSTILIAVNLGGERWDEPSVWTAKQLETMCENGMFANTYNSNNGGYSRGFTQKALAVRTSFGNMTRGDYQRVRKWFSRNCPDGW